MTNNTTCRRNSNAMQHSSPSEAYRWSGLQIQTSLEPEAPHRFLKTATDLCPKTDKSNPHTPIRLFFFSSRNTITNPMLIARKRSCPSTPCTTVAASTFFISFTRRFLISSPHSNRFDYQKGNDIQTIYFSDQHKAKITESLRQVDPHGVFKKNGYLVSSLLVVIISHIFPFLYQRFCLWHVICLL